MLNSDFLKFTETSEATTVSDLIVSYIEKTNRLEKMIKLSGEDVDIDDLLIDLEQYDSNLDIRKFIQTCKEHAAKDKRQTEVNFLDVIRALHFEDKNMIDIFEANEVELYKLEKFLTGDTDFDSIILEKNGLISPPVCKPEHFVERNDIVMQMVRIINHHDNNNILLYGTEGSGKSSIAERIKDYTKNRTVRKNEALDLFQHVKNFGELENIVDGQIKQLNSLTEDSVYILDDFHNIVDSGIIKNPDIFFNFFKQVLKNKKTSIIIVVSEDYYKKIKDKDYVKRFFNPIAITELNHKETKEHILKRLSDFENHHQTKIDENHIDYIIENSINYKELSNPEKIIKIIDNLFSKNQKKKLGKKEIDNVLFQFGKQKNDHKSYSIKDIEAFIKNKVFGQDEAVEAVVEELSIYLAGMKQERKPIGSFLFSGQTGVGKTELAKQLKNSLGLDDNKFIVYDMSEYKEKHSISKLIGAPPGYIGFDSDSTIFDKMKGHSDEINVLLFDEVEKAHSEVLDIMLQMLEEGRVTDSKGRVTDFSNSIIIFTTNKGASTAAESSIGLGGNNSPNIAKAKKEVSRFFSPEFRNRLSAIVDFKPLKNKKTLTSIAYRHIKELVIDAADIKITISDDVASYIIEKGYDPQYGARNLQEIISKNLIKKIASIILEGNTLSIDISVVDKELKFKKNP